MSPKVRRLLFGIFLLIVVNILWVASSEISKWLFTDQHYVNAYFATYIKTCLFMLYLLGFIFHRPWRDQILKNKEASPKIKDLAKFVQDESDGEEGSDTDSVDVFSDNDSTSFLSQPVYEPLRKESDSDKSSLASEPDDHESIKMKTRSRLVRFKKTKEVRKMPESDAEAALIARLPHDVWIKVTSFVKQYHHKLPVRQVYYLAFQFTFVWFLGNLAYHEALKYTEAAVVNGLSSISGLFTLVLAAIFPACSSDKITLSKLCVVLLSIFGVGIVTYADKGTLEIGIPKGAIWSLVGSLCYAIYLVFLRRRVESEDKLDIPMFFGFVGFISTCIMWPGLFILHATGLEPFYPLPNRTQFAYMIVNGVIGTVLSEYLWLCGCFLTSSLTATLAMSVTIPITVLADQIIRRTQYSILFYVGFVPIISSVIFSSLLQHYNNWDPIYYIMCGLWTRTFHYPYLGYSQLRKMCIPRRAGINSTFNGNKSKNSTEEVEKLIDEQT